MGSKTTATRSRKLVDTAKLSRKARRKRLKEFIAKLSLRQIKYRKNRLAGMNIYAAARAAGYSENYSRNHASTKLNRIVKNSIIEELEMAGATDQLQARKLLEIALNATKQQSATFEVQEGETGDLEIRNDVRVEVPDYAVRLKGWETIAKIKKQIVTSMAAVIPEMEFTRLSIVVEREKKDENPRKDNGPDVEAVKSVGVTHRW